MDLERGRAFLAEIRRERAAEEERHRISAERIERYRQYEAYVAMMLEGGELPSPAPVQNFPPPPTPEDAPPERVGSETNSVVTKSRPDRIEDAIREAGGVLTTAQIAEKLRDEGDGEQFDRHEFWRIIDAALRKGALRGRFRKVGSAKWALVRPGRPPVPDSLKPNPSVTTGGKSGPQKGDLRLWQRIELIMSGVGRSMSRPEIAEALIKNGYTTKVTKDAFLHHINISMKRQGKRFHRNDDGTWSLINVGQTENLVDRGETNAFPRLRELIHGEPKD